MTDKVRGRAPWVWSRAPHLSSTVQIVTWFLLSTLAHGPCFFLSLSQEKVTRSNERRSSKEKATDYNTKV